MKRLFALLLMSSLALGAPLPAQASPTGPAGTAPGVTGAVEAYDLNLVTYDELVTIRGIGPVLAERIIEYRSSHGPFSSVDELVQVRGIGEQSLSRIRSHFTLTAPPSPVANSRTTSLP